MGQEFKVGEAPWEVSQPQTFEVGSAPWETLPEIPKDVSRLPIPEAESIKKAYEDAGQDSGIDFVYSNGPEDMREKIAVKATPSAFQSTKGYFNRVNGSMTPTSQAVNEQFIEGILRPAEELFLDTQETLRQHGQKIADSSLVPQPVRTILTAGTVAVKAIYGDKPVPERTLTEGAKAWEALSPEEKVAFTSGYALTSIASGGVVNILQQGAVKYSVKALGKGALTSNLPAQVYKKSLKAIENLPTEKLQDIAGAMARTIIKDGPTLAAEGLVYGTLVNRGDVKEGLKEAGAFTLLGTTIGAGLRTFSRAKAGKTAKEFTAQELEHQDISKKVNAYEAEQSTLARREMDKLYNKMDLPEIISQPAPLKIDSKVWESTKKWEMAREQSIQQTEKYGKAITLNRQFLPLLQQNETLSKQVDKLRTKRKQAYERIAEKQTDLQVEERFRTLTELEASYQTKALFEKTFGTTDNFRKAVDDLEGMIDLGGGDPSTLDLAAQKYGSVKMDRSVLAMDVLTDRGFTPQQALVITDQLLKPSTIANRVSLTEKKAAIIRTHEIKKLEKKIQLLEREQLRTKNKMIQMVRDPNFDMNFGTQGKQKLKDLKESFHIENFRESLTKLGIDTSLPGFKPMGKGKLSKHNLYMKNAYYGRIEEMTGIPVQQVQWNLVKANTAKSHIMNSFQEFKLGDRFKNLQNRKISGDAVFDLMHYVEKDPKTGQIRFNPEAIEKTGDGWIARPKWEGAVPSQEVQDELFEIRKALIAARDVQKKAGVDLGDIHNYVPAWKRVSTGKALGFRKSTVPGKGGHTQRRQSGMPDKDIRPLYKTDFYKLMPEYLNKAVTEASYHQVNKETASAFFMMKAMGLKGEAEEFLKYVGRSKGYAKLSKTDTVNAMIDNMVIGSKEWKDEIERAYRQSGGDEVSSLGEDLLKEAREIMYHGALGVNPGTLALQFIQPDILGAPMTGIQNMVVGKSLAYAIYARNAPKNVLNTIDKAYTKEKFPVDGKLMREAQDDLNRVADRLIPDQVLDENLTPTQRQWVKNLGRILKLPGIPGMKMFSELDKLNRYSTFLAAKRQWRDGVSKGNVDKMMSEFMTDTEKATVARVLEKNGIDAAGDEYGLIVSKKANFAYDIAEKPEIFSEGIGSMIPFTNFTTNAIAIHGQALQKALGGKVLPAAKLAGYQLAGVWATQALFNHEYYPQKIPVPGVGTITVSSGMPMSAPLALTDMALDPLSAIKEVPGKLFPYNRAVKELEKLRGPLFDKEGRKKWKAKQMKKKAATAGSTFPIKFVPKKPKKKKPLY